MQAFHDRIEAVVPERSPEEITAELEEKLTSLLGTPQLPWEAATGLASVERRVYKNALRAVNEEYKLGFTSVDFKKMHTTKLGKEIIEQMKTRK